MSSRKSKVVPLIPAPRNTLAERTAKQQQERAVELLECSQQINGLLQQYAATFDVKRIVSLNAQGMETVLYKLDVVSLP